MAKTKSKTEIATVKKFNPLTASWDNDTQRDKERKAGVAKRPVPLKEYNIATGVVLKNLEKKALPISKSLQSFKIKTADDYTRKVTQTKLLKELKKEAEKLEATIRQPLKDADKATAALFKPFYESVAILESQVKTEMLEYDEKQQQKLGMLDAKFESTGMSVGSYTKKAAEATAHQGGTLRTRKVLSIVDPGQVPREYMKPDEKAIEAALRLGIKIAGCELIEVKTAAI